MKPNRKNQQRDARDLNEAIEILRLANLAARDRHDGLLAGMIDLAASRLFDLRERHEGVAA